jgi:hypothetical protein
MNRCCIEPIERVRFEIEIDEGRETECQIRAGQLASIRTEQLGMFLNRGVVERTHVADVNMRIDQSRNEKAAASIDLFRVCAGDKIGSNLCDPSITNDNSGMDEGGRPL